MYVYMYIHVYTYIYIYIYIYDLDEHDLDEHNLVMLAVQEHRTTAQRAPTQRSSFVDGARSPSPDEYERLCAGSTRWASRSSHEIETFNKCTQQHVDRTRLTFICPQSTQAPRAAACSCALRRA